MAMHYVARSIVFCSQTSVLVKSGRLNLSTELRLYGSRQLVATLSQASTLDVFNS